MSRAHSDEPAPPRSLPGGGDPATVARVAADQPFAEDLVLARACLAGDEVALARLVRRLACLPRILEALSMRMGNPLDEQEVEDLAQETLVIAWKKLATFTGEARLETWSYGLARYEILNAIRRKRSRPDGRAEQPNEDAAGPGSASGHELDREYLAAAVSALDRAEAEVVRLKHFEDLTFEDIAARLAITSSTAKTRYYRGLERLHERLRGKLGGLDG